MTCFLSSRTVLTLHLLECRKSQIRKYNEVWVINHLSDPISIVVDVSSTPPRVIRTLLVGDEPRDISGNQTTTLNEKIVCDGGAFAGPCFVDFASAPGGLPFPNTDSNNQPQFEVGLIVKFNGFSWIDELNRDWSAFVRFNLPDVPNGQINAADVLLIQLRILGLKTF
jgi:hypothetical protein